MDAASLSVVIPALDEEHHVAAAVRSVRDDAAVMVVDGGSRDGTREAAAAAGATVMVSARGRGVQLHAGARAAQGDWIVFLHADTRLERGWAAALRALPGAIVGGAFRFTLDPPRPAYRWIEAGVALRCRWLRLPYGDQGLFARREVYESIGGFRPLPLMEDVDFVRRLARAGPLAFPAARAFTSARRWERRGVVATTLENWALAARHALGASPETLARGHEGKAESPRPEEISGGA